MTERIPRVNLEESKCVIMKCDTVLPGMADWYYTTVNEYLDLENSNLLWKYVSAKNYF